jgi:hypothetical protein
MAVLCSVEDGYPQASSNKTSHHTPSWKDLLRIVAPGIGLGGLHVRREDTGH